ncbi:MAG: acyltransferase [Pseudomonadota bacterium]
MTDSYKVQQSLSSGDATSLQRYMDLVLGQRNIWALIKYELIILIAAGFRGAPGLFLRKILYPLILGSVGKNVIFGSNVSLRHPHKIRLGDGVMIDDNVMLDAKGTDNSGIRIDNGAFIGRNTIIGCKDGDITIGENSNIGFNCTVATTSQITIGRDNIIAAYSYIIGGGNYHYDNIDVPMCQAYDYGGKGGVTLMDDVWIGSHVSVLDGVTVEEGCVVASGSVVTKNLPARSVSLGTPAQPVRQRL